jgi:peptidoglycan/xylan/chitin deacetylase (PgdA/CDA1 family)
MKTESGPALRVIAYHYVRDRVRTAFPALHAFSTDAFRRQVLDLQAEYEMATVESTVDFIAGRYVPRRDLCLLTFDDGLRDHYEEVLPILMERRIQGTFFIITGCLEGRVAYPHKNHFLMAHLGFAEYARRVWEGLRHLSPEDTAVDPHVARRTYRWDGDEVAQFKYLLNFRLPAAVRDVVISEVFAESLGDEEAFARQLYLDWSDARSMQSLGMVMGGHTHSHPSLARLSPDEQRQELTACTVSLRDKLPNQAIWPFAYPFGKLDALNDVSVELLRELGYACAFTTVPGTNGTGTDLFRLHRLDPKENRTIGSNTNGSTS